MPFGDQAGLEAEQRLELLFKTTIKPELDRVLAEMAAIRGLVEKLLNKKVVLTFEDKN